MQPAPSVICATSASRLYSLKARARFISCLTPKSRTTLCSVQWHVLILLPIMKATLREVKRTAVDGDRKRPLQVQMLLDHGVPGAAVQRAVARL